MTDISRESSCTLAKLFYDCCLVDTWRYLHPTVSGFTWFCPDGSLASCTDLVGCYVSLISSVVSCDVIPCPFSDHCSVFLSFSIPDVLAPGPGLWKLNISVLDEIEYVTLISNFWSNWKLRKSNFSSILEWWEAGKSWLKGLSVSYCKDRAANNRKTHDLLVNLISHLKGHVDAGFVSNIGPYRSALSELERFDRLTA